MFRKPDQDKEPEQNIFDDEIANDEAAMLFWVDLLLNDPSQQEVFDTYFEEFNQLYHVSPPTSAELNQSMSLYVQFNDFNDELPKEKSEQERLEEARHLGLEHRGMQERAMREAEDSGLLFQEKLSTGNAPSKNPRTQPITEKDLEVHDKILREIYTSATEKEVEVYRQVQQENNRSSSNKRKTTSLPKSSFNTVLKKIEHQDERKNKLNEAAKLGAEHTRKQELLAQEEKHKRLEKLLKSPSKPEPASPSSYKRGDMSAFSVRSLRKLIGPNTVSPTASQRFYDNPSDDEVLKIMKQAKESNKKEQKQIPISKKDAEFYKQYQEEKQSKSVAKRRPNKVNISAKDEEFYKQYQEDNNISKKQKR